MRYKMNKNGTRAEQAFTRQFNATSNVDRRMKLRGIDAILTTDSEEQITVSVKDQEYSSEKFGGITVETKMLNTVTGATRIGNLFASHADTYAWLVSIAGVRHWLVFKAKSLRDYCELGGHAEYHTTLESEARNRSVGRVFDRTMGYKFTLDQLLALDFINCIKFGGRYGK